ncbi:MAG TPA: hypothetical protein VF310_02810 [Vicinamibacteria bacterium]
MAIPRRFLALALVVFFPVADVGAASLRSGSGAWCATSVRGGRDAAWAHREQDARLRRTRISSAAASFDVGQIAVLLDQGDLALPANVLDLQAAALRFSPSADGYTVSRIDLPMEPEAGTALGLADDDSRQVALGFAFPFFGKSYTEAFVNSDGNVTFGQKDDASTERNVGRLVGGPPRAAPLLADFDPSAGGSVSVSVMKDHATVTWSAVPQFGETDRNTFQVALWADGRVDFVYGQTLNAALDQGVAGIAPGAPQAGLTAVDFSTAAKVSGGSGALAETFRAESAIDEVAVARRFYASHPDEYQQLVIYTSQRLVSSGTFAYSLPVKNGDRGIGEEVHDFSDVFGSAGKLETFIMMDALSKYPDDLSRRFLGEDTALSVLAHEVGHRWLAYALFRDGSSNSTDLLGRDQAHWSFFFDSDGSFLEGNDIQDLGNGTFRTAGASLRYSALDQYLMGLRDASEVPPVFVVRGPTGTDTDPGRTPRSGVSFSGTRKEVTVADIVAALGSRSPAGAPSTTAIRQAFVYVAVGGAADPQAIEKLERIRAAWPAFFHEGADKRATVDPRLN